VKVSFVGNLQTARGLAGKILFQFLQARPFTHNDKEIAGGSQLSG
jgi:hypothetical protein